MLSEEKEEEGQKKSNGTVSTKRQNELYDEVWNLFSQGTTDVPALLPRQARGTHKKSSL